MKSTLRTLLVLPALLFFAIAPFLGGVAPAAADTITRIMGVIDRVGADNSITIDGKNYSPAPALSQRTSSLPALHAGVTVTLYATSKQSGGGLYYTDIALGLGTLPEIAVPPVEPNPDEIPQ